MGNNIGSIIIASDNLNHDEYKILLGKYYSLKIFDKYKTKDNHISKLNIIHGFSCCFDLSDDYIINEEDNKMRMKIVHWLRTYTMIPWVYTERYSRLFITNGDSTIKRIYKKLTSNLSDSTYLHTIGIEKYHIDDIKIAFISYFTNKLIQSQSYIKYNNYYEELDRIYTDIVKWLRLKASIKLLNAKSYTVLLMNNHIFHIKQLKSIILQNENYLQQLGFEYYDIQMMLKAFQGYIISHRSCPELIQITTKEEEEYELAYHTIYQWLQNKPKIISKHAKQYTKHFLDLGLYYIECVYFVLYELNQIDFLHKCNILECDQIEIREMFHKDLLFHRKQWKVIKKQWYSKLKTLKRHHTSYYCQGIWFCCKRPGKWAEGCQSGMFSHHLGYFIDQEDPGMWSECKCLGRLTSGCKPGLISIHKLTSKIHYDEDRESEYIGKLHILYQSLWKDQHHPGLFKDSMWQCCMNKNIYAIGCQGNSDPTMLKHHDSYYQSYNIEYPSATNPQSNLKLSMMITSTNTNTMNTITTNNNTKDNTTTKNKNKAIKKNAFLNTSLHKTPLEDTGIWLCCKNPERSCTGCVDGIQDAYSLLVNFDHPEIDHILTMSIK